MLSIDREIILKMKNLFIFYLGIFLPLAAIVLAAKYHYISNANFAIFLVIYFIFYHPSICGMRLVQKEEIPVSKFWNVYIPGWTSKYVKSLFFRN
jgi:hypothetical protein